jgi:hypothetical protein
MSEPAPAHDEAIVGDARMFDDLLAEQLAVFDAVPLTVERCEPWPPAPEDPAHRRPGKHLVAAGSGQPPLF